MTFLERVVVERAAEQTSALPRGHEARRVVCRCGCGRWWYWPKREGRPREYATHACWSKARNERRRVGASLSSDAGEP